jgi:hypothetical protein
MLIWLLWGIVTGKLWQTNAKDGNEAFFVDSGLIINVYLPA